MELQNAFQNSSIDIIVLSELRREGEHLIQTKVGNTFCHYDHNIGQRGVELLIKEK